jgi:hypothetical protein
LTKLGPLASVSTYETADVVVSGVGITAEVNAFSNNVEIDQAGNLGESKISPDYYVGSDQVIVRKFRSKFPVGSQPLTYSVAVTWW